MKMKTIMKTHSGFTLIEVLIAVVLLAGALLGLAGLQARVLSNNQSAYNRSQATQLAYDIADRMRANTNSSVAANNNDALVIYTTFLPSTGIQKPNCLTTTGCSQVDMANNDLFEWNLALATLPNGQGLVCKDSTPKDGTSTAASACDGAGADYHIKIWWDDDKSGTNQLFVVGFKL